MIICNILYTRWEKERDMPYGTPHNTQRIPPFLSAGHMQRIMSITSVYKHILRKIALDMMCYVIIYS